MKIVLDTQRHSIPNTAVAIRKTTTLHQQYSRMSVRETQSRDLTTARKNANATVVTYKCVCWKKKQEMQENDKCGLCGVGLLTRRSDVRSSWIIGIIQSVKKNVETIFQSTVAAHLTTNSSTNHPIATKSKKMGVPVAPPAWGFYWYSPVSARVRWQFVLPNNTRFAALPAERRPRCA